MSHNIVHYTSADIDLTNDFEGGNLLLLNREGNTFQLNPDLWNCTDKSWFYWSFRAVFKKTDVYRFEFSDYKIGTRGPALSYNGGLDWEWLTDSHYEPDSFFEYSATEGEVVDFCQCIPYRMPHLISFLDRIDISPVCKIFELSKTLKGRSVPAIKISNPDDTEKQALFFACRHHAQESMASYALEGIIESVIEETAFADEIRKRFEIYAIPMVDVDGVIEGIQGKCQEPHDPNRDYGNSEYFFPQVAALNALTEEKKPVFILDLHCPWIRNGMNEFAFLVGNKNENQKVPLARFAEILEQEAPPQAPIYEKDNLPYGVDWNSDKSFTQGSGYAKHFSNYSFAFFSHTVEVPFAAFREKTQTPETIREFGRAITRAIYRFL